MSAPHTPSNLAENPWFWLALFGGMGMLGVVVIGPKFGARMARVERMAETRERVAIERANRASIREREAAGVQEPANGQAGEKPAVPPAPEPYVESDFHQPPASLKYLLGLMTIAMLVGTTGVLVTRGRERRALSERAAMEAAAGVDAPNAEP